MKGLLLKDFYLAKKYCRTYLLLVVVLLAASVFGDDNVFFNIYPSAISCMIPITLLAYDERSKWSEYCGTLPLSKAQQVSSKYLIGLFGQIFAVVLLSIAQMLRMYMQGAFDVKWYLSVLATAFIVFCFTSTISLPFVFKMGVEKGRIVYLFMIGIICAVSVAMSVYSGPGLSGIINLSSVSLPVIMAVSAALYIFSWYISVVFYKRRKL